MAIGASEPVLQHVSSRPAGRDSEVRMPWKKKIGACVASEVFGVNGGFSWIFFRWATNMK